MPIIRIIDFETTGLEPTDLVIETGWSDLDTVELSPVAGQSRLHGAPDVPPEVRAIHHIQPSDVAHLPPFDAEDFVREMIDADIDGVAAHNMAFEGQWVGRHLDGVIHVICTYKCALQVWPEAPSHGNMELLYWLQDQNLITPSLPLTQPSHRAGPDCYTTAHLLAAMFRAGITGQQMVTWTKQPRLLPRCPIGDHKGKPWADVDYGFLRWITGKDGMDEDIVWNAQNEINRRRG